MEPKEIIDAAGDLVTGDRHEKYGDAKENFTAIAELWSAYLNAKHLLDVQLEPRDVGMLMVLLKVGRVATGTHAIDNYKDIAGYAGLSGGIIHE